jgi:hypothetical protein
MGGCRTRQLALGIEHDDGAWITPQVRDQDCRGFSGAAEPGALEQCQEDIPHTVVGQRTSTARYEERVTAKHVASGRVRDGALRDHHAEQAVERLGQCQPPESYRRRGVSSYISRSMSPSACGGQVMSLCRGSAWMASGVTVRDRDRLHQEILEDFRWKLYRLWSTDWFTDTDREMEKMLAWLEVIRKFQWPQTLPILIFDAIPQQGRDRRRSLICNGGAPEARYWDVSSAPACPPITTTVVREVSPA